ncbi:MAG TPA: ATP-binding protein, partial [Candidatus Berkiella sp.]|nr:ATP-binding protein [Candidatus Berkiella sp.]
MKPNTNEDDIHQALVKWLESLALSPQQMTSQEGNPSEKSAAKEVVVAYSGGRDSHVLLHALASLRIQYPFSLRAIHINHGLQVQAK